MYRSIRPYLLIVLMYALIGGLLLPFLSAGQAIGTVAFFAGFTCLLERCKHTPRLTLLLAVKFGKLLFAIPFLLYILYSHAENGWTWIGAFGILYLISLIGETVWIAQSHQEPSHTHEITL